MACSSSLVLWGQHPGLHRPRRRRRRPGRPGRSTRVRTASARSCTPSPARPATTARPSRGLTGNTPFYNVAGALAMLVGRFGMIVPILAHRRSMAAKRRVAPSSGTFPTTACLFVVLLVGVVIIVGALNFFPALALDRSSSSSSRTPGRSSAMTSFDSTCARHAPLPALRHSSAAPSRGPSRRSPRGILDPAAAPRRPPARRPQAGPAPPRPQPGHVRGRDHGGPGDAHRPRGSPASQSGGGAGSGFDVQIAVWLWFTVLFATYAEAVAEARGRAQAATLRKTRSVTMAHRRCADGALSDVGSAELRAGDIVVVSEGETIPCDGDVIEGVAYVNEAAITGESAPVLKEPGTDIRSSVTGGTTLVSDWLAIRITADPGETFLDRMIALVEGAKRQKTPNELALSILLAGLTLVFLLATVTLQPFGALRGRLGQRRGPGGPARVPHPHHHRRPPVRHRHRGHGSRRALQRAGHERPGGGGGRRRGRHPARQDRDDHVRQPARLGDPAGARASRRARPSNWRSCPRSGTRRPRAAPS